MNIGVIDLIIIGGAVAVFLTPLLIGYLGFGSPNQRHPLLMKALIGIAGLQLVVLVYFGWIFGAERYRHVNHLKWIAPLIFVDLMMWVCFGIGFGVAALRYRIKTKK
jgi:ABC-type transport system involved in multi-copper enzyme maturation permease subunit